MGINEVDWPTTMSAIESGSGSSGLPVGLIILLAIMWVAFAWRDLNGEGKYGDIKVGRYIVPTIVSIAAFIFAAGVSL